MTASCQTAILAVQEQGQQEQLSLASHHSRQTAIPALLQQALDHLEGLRLMLALRQGHQTAMPALLQQALDHLEGLRLRLALRQGRQTAKMLAPWSSFRASGEGKARGEVASSLRHNALADCADLQPRCANRLGSNMCVPLQRRRISGG